MRPVDNLSLSKLDGATMGPDKEESLMRCLLKVSIAVEAGNAAISDGSLPKTIDSILSELKPEATYFTDDDGKRTGFIFFDLKEPAQIPAVAEPWFFAFNAQIELHPAMNLEDLKKATPGIERAVKNYRITVRRPPQR